MFYPNTGQCLFPPRHKFYFCHPVPCSFFRASIPPPVIPVDNVRLPKTSSGKSPKGSVKLSFFLNADGRLASTPEVRESSDPSLEEAAKEAVKRSEPFPVFPSQLKQPKKQFILDLVFE